MKIQTTGHIKTTTVPGTSPTGLYNADGSVNVVVAPGTVPVGAYHPCGALYVTVTTDKSKSHNAPDGSVHVYFNGSFNELLRP